MHSSKDGQTLSAKSPTPKPKKGKSRLTRQELIGQIIDLELEVDYTKEHLYKCQRQSDKYLGDLSAAYSKMIKLQNDHLKTLEEYEDCQNKYIAVLQISEDYGETIGYPPLKRDLVGCMPSRSALAKMFKSAN